MLCHDFFLPIRSLKTHGLVLSVSISLDHPGIREFWLVRLVLFRDIKRKSMFFSFWAFYHVAFSFDFVSRYFFFKVWFSRI